MMKKLLLFCCAVLLMYSAQAQDKQNVIKLNFVGAFLQSYTLAFERAINEASSVQLSVGYRTYDVTSTATFSGQESVWNYSGFTIVPEYRYYLTTKNKPLPAGFYVAPFLRYSSFTDEYDDGDDDDYNYTEKTHPSEAVLC